MSAADSRARSAEAASPGPGDARARVATARRLLADLDASAPDRLNKHVDVFDEVHRALQDALTLAEP